MNLELLASLPVSIQSQQMVLPSRFLGAFAKHRRAQTHIAALSEAIQSYDATHPWEPEQSADLGEGMVRIRIKELPPADISLILGDVVHNLRASLDYATCSLVEFGNDGADLSRTQFPFGTRETPLSKKERENASLGNIFPHALTMIEEARRCGDPWLDVLRLLSNQDKHRLLLTTVFRQFPMKVAIDRENNIAEIVPDHSNINVWLRPISDGDVIPMPSILHFKQGVVVEEAEAPYAITVINEINRVVGLALRLMATAVDIPEPKKATARS